MDDGGAPLGYSCDVTLDRSADLKALSGVRGFKARHVDDPVFEGEVFVIELGRPSDPPVLMVHGIGDRAALDWGVLAAHLAGRHRVMLFDLPGFGDSSRANELYSPDNYVAFIEHLVDTHFERPLSLVGHSMGGAISLRYAGENPDDLERLVLVDVAGIMHRHAFGEHMMRMGISEIPALDKIAGGAVEWIAQSVARPFFSKEPNPALLFELAGVRRKVLGGDPEKIAGLMLMLTDFGESIDGVRTPPLLVWGQDDRIAPVRTGRLLQDRIPGAVLEVLPRCGHVPMTDQPARLLELVGTWLAASPRPHPGPPAPAAEVTSTRVRRIEGQGELDLRDAEYLRVELERCRGRVQGLRAGSVILRGCDVELDGCVIGEAEVGLTLEHSQVTVTGGSIRGVDAVSMEASQLDLAGTTLRGQLSAVRAAEETQVLFSVCNVHSPLRPDRVRAHGMLTASPRRSI